MDAILAVRKMDAAARAELVALLQLAFSGELAAAHAYRGHARSVREAGERARIGRIEEEEWHHRQRVGEMLAELGAAPDAARERRALAIGRTLGELCRVIGWLAPMYGAGRLESRNVGEYERAARLAWCAGRGEWVDELLRMAEVEWEHEGYFRAQVLAHPLGRRLPLWPAPGPLAEIRASFDRECGRDRLPSPRPLGTAAAPPPRAHADPAPSA